MAKIDANFSFYGKNPDDEDILKQHKIKGLLKGHGYSYTKVYKPNEKRDFGKIEDDPSDPYFYMYISVELTEDPNIQSNVVLVEVDKTKFKDPNYKKINITFDKYYVKNSTKAGAANTIIIGSGHPK